MIHFNCFEIEDVISAYLVEDGLCQFKDNICGGS